MKRVNVISGVTGMTGSVVAGLLLEKGETVLGFDNFFCSDPKTAEALKTKGLRFFEYDINSAQNMQALFSLIASNYAAGYELCFINCAAVVHTKHFYHPDDTFATNVLGMKSTLDLCLAHGFATYINCSTSEVYSMASWREGGVLEDDPVLMATAGQTLRTSYAAGKLLTEFFMRDAAERGLIKGCSIRFANVYSPEELHSDHIIPHIIDSIIKNGAVTLMENARDTQRTFLHNADSSRSVISLMNADTALDGGLYNVGTNEEIGIVELTELIGHKMGLTQVPIKFEGFRSADPKRRLLNTDKIKTRAGWLPEIGLDEGLDQCIQARVKRAGRA